MKHHARLASDSESCFGVAPTVDYRMTRTPVTRGYNPVQQLTWRPRISISFDPAVPALDQWNQLLATNAEVLSGAREEQQFMLKYVLPAYVSLRGPELAELVTDFLRAENGHLPGIAQVTLGPELDRDVYRIELILGTGTTRKFIHEFGDAYGLVWVPEEVPQPELDYNVVQLDQE